MGTSLSEVYNGFAETYEFNRGSFDISQILEKFSHLLPQNSGELLDLGCGAGEPVARYFINKGWKVTGVDFSERMLELSAKYAPEMLAIRGDIREVEFQQSQFDAITATYSLFHIPAEEHANIFRKIHRWLKPNAKVLFTYATEKYTGAKKFNGYKRFIDTDLFYSHVTPEELNSTLVEIGFDINSAEYHTICNETFLWMTASKKSS